MEEEESQENVLGEGGFMVDLLLCLNAICFLEQIARPTSGIIFRRRPISPQRDGGDLGEAVGPFCFLIRY